ncbi:lasso RiPP family leader peptide-containing protein [Streptomyces sp. NPDC003077]
METRETEIVYQAPELVAVGDFAELTLGKSAPDAENYTGMGGW